MINRKILITGGAGFIGTPIAEDLQYKGYEVFFYDLQDGQDVLDYINLENAIHKVDGVIHLAGILGTGKTIKDSALARRTIEVNIIGGFNAIDICQKLDKRLVLLDNGNYFADSPYPATKACICSIARSFAQWRGLDVDIVRAYNVYGPDQSTKQNKYAPNWIMAAINNQPLEVYGDGDQILDPIYVVDAARIIAEVFTTGKGDGTTYEAGTGVGWTANKFAELVIELAESKSEIVHVGLPPGEKPGQVVKAFNPYWPVDAFSNLRETLKGTIEYYRQYYGSSTR